MNRTCLRRWLVYLEILLIAGGMLAIARWVLSHEGIGPPATRHGRAHAFPLSADRHTSSPT
jgi:hypothetical protein